VFWFVSHELFSRFSSTIFQTPQIVLAPLTFEEKWSWLLSASEMKTCQQGRKEVHVTKCFPLSNGMPKLIFFPYAFPYPLPEPEALYFKFK